MRQPCRQAFGGGGCSAAPAADTRGGGEPGSPTLQPTVMGGESTGSMNAHAIACTVLGSQIRTLANGVGVTGLGGSSVFLELPIKARNVTSRGESPYQCMCSQELGIDTHKTVLSRYFRWVRSRRSAQSVLSPPLAGDPDRPHSRIRLWMPHRLAAQEMI